jgi:eukaryotic-like serine/threonine-protein kinase
LPVVDPTSSNEELLVAVLAVQLGFAKPEQVLSAAASWMTDRTQTLADRLQADGVLSPERRALIEKLLEEAVQAAGGNPNQIMDSLGGEPVLKKAFANSIVLEPDGKLRTIEDRIPIQSRERIKDPGPIFLQGSGRYEIRSEHGRGGQARVMLAFDRVIGREIALKELLPERVSSPSGAEKTLSLTTAAARFLREARITGQLDHPAIVPVYEIGRNEEGRLYYTMQLVRGRTFAQALSSCKTIGDRLRLLDHFLDLCQAIAFAHSRRVIHRDIKPENVMVGEFGETVLLDWGLAKVKGQEDVRGHELERRIQLMAQENPGNTLSGAAVGTPSYMSPEQAEGLIEEIDEQSDVWGLGAVLYEILTGHPPFDGATAHEIIGKAMKEEVRPVEIVCKEAPRDLASIAEKALRRKKSERYRSAQDLSNDVTAFMTGGKVGAHEYSSIELLKRFAAKNKAVVAASGAVFLIILVAFGIVFRSYQREKEALSRERVERLKASFSNAQAYAERAGRSQGEKRLLSSRVYAAASLVANPAYFKSPIFDPPFLQNLPAEDDTIVSAVSSIYFADHKSPISAERVLPMENGVIEAAYSPDGQYLGAVDRAGFIAVWETKGWTELFRVQGHTDRANSISFFPGTRKLVTGGQDKILRTWEIGVKAPLRSIGGIQSAVMAVAASPDGKYFVSGENNGEIHLWDSETGQLLRSLEKHSDAVWSVTISADNRFLASSSWDKTIGLFDLLTFQKVRSIGGFTSIITSVRFSPDGHKLLAVTWDGQAKILEVESGVVSMTFGKNDYPIQFSSFSPDGAYIVTADLNRSISLWKGPAFDLVMQVEAHKEPVSSVVFSPDARWLATTSPDRTVKIWRFDVGHPPVEIKTSNGVYGIDISKDGRWIATVGEEQVGHLWNAHNGNLVRVFEETGKKNKTVAFSPDGALLAAGGEDAVVRLIDVSTGKIVRVLEDLKGGIWQVAFSGDGTKIAAGGRKEDAFLWDVKTGRQIFKFGTSGDSIYGLCFSPDDKKLALAEEDGSVSLWDRATGKWLKKFKGHTDTVSGVAFSHNGRWLASSGKDKQVILWELESGKEIIRFVGHKQWVNRVNFSNDDRWLATTSDDNWAILWEVQTGKALLRLPAAFGWRIAFTPDGRSIAVTDQNSVVLYPLDLEVIKTDPQELFKEAQRQGGLKLNGFAIESVDR